MTLNSVRNSASNKIKTRHFLNVHVVTKKSFVEKLVNSEKDRIPISGFVHLRSRKQYLFIACELRSCARKNLLLFKYLVELQYFFFLLSLYFRRIISFAFKTTKVFDETFMLR